MLHSDGDSAGVVPLGFDSAGSWFCIFNIRPRKEIDL